jgi:hypothetical protein
MTALLVMAAFATASMIFVYRFRGNARYSGLSEYLRKGWPTRHADPIAQSLRYPLAAGAVQLFSRPL